MYYLFLDSRLLAPDSIIDIVQAPGDVDKHLHARPIEEADNEADSSAAAKDQPIRRVLIDKSHNAQHDKHNSADDEQCQQ